MVWIDFPYVTQTLSSFDHMIHWLLQVTQKHSSFDRCHHGERGGWDLLTSMRYNLIFIFRSIFRYIFEVFSISRNAFVGWEVTYCVIPLSTKPSGLNNPCEILRNHDFTRFHKQWCFHLISHDFTCEKVCNMASE